MPTYQQRFGHAPAPPKPKRKRKRHPPAVPPTPRRSRSLAQREGGIVHLKQEPREAGIGRKPRLTPAQRRIANQLVSGYERGPRIGKLGRGLESLGRAYENNPVARNPIVGRKGLLGGVEDLVKSVDPITIGQTLKGRVEHPLREDKSAISAGIVVPGFGGRFGVKGSEVAPEEAPPPAAAEVARSLGGARRKYAEQKKLRSAERSVRVERGQAAMEEAGGGTAGFKAAMREQRGELPKTTFERLRQGNLATADVENLVRHAQNHPELKFWEKQNVTKALLDAFEHGRTPAPHEIRLLQTAFGQDAAAALSHTSRLVKAGHIALDVANIPRTLMASVDLSAPFRQGLVAGARHPGIFARNFKPMIRAFGSERVYKAVLEDIQARPTFEQMQEAGVKFTTTGRDVAEREEQFISHTAGRLPLVKSSARAYTAFLDKMRADMFDRQLELARKQSVNVEDRAQLRSIARLVNNATGRGDLGPVEHWAPAMNAFFFSPRLIGSRISMLNPLWYASLTPFARRQALISMIRLGSVAAGVLGLGSYAGAKVTTDPRSADFAKLRIGNTRADVLGGFQQYLRVGSQIATGKVISSTTGRTMTLGPGFGDMSRKDILERFAVGKFAPPPSFVYDFFKGTQFDGQPFSVKKAILARTIPLVLQDAHDLYKNSDSIPLALLGYSISAFGIGMQTYSNQAVAKAGKTLHEATAQQNVHLRNLVHKGELSKKQVGEYREALDIYDKRNQLNTTIEAATTDKPLAREQQKMDGLLSLLGKHKLLKPAEIKRYRHHYATADLTAKEIQRDRAWFWDNSGVGPMITWYRGKAGAND